MTKKELFDKVMELKDVPDETEVFDSFEGQFCTIENVVFEPESSDDGDEHEARVLIIVGEAI